MLIIMTIIMVITTYHWLGVVIMKNNLIIILINKIKLKSIINLLAISLATFHFSTAPLVALGEPHF